MSTYTLLSAFLLLASTAIAAAPAGSSAVVGDTGSATKQAATAATPRGDPLVVERADRSFGSMSNGKMITELQGNVQVRWDSLRVKAQSVKFVREDGTATLSDQVSLAKENQILTCDRLTYFKKDRYLLASGHVVYDDKKNQAKLTGNEGKYDRATKELTITGNPRFYRFDTTNAETLTITSRVITYNDSFSIASAREQVVITKGLLRSTCALAHYYARKGRATLRGTPHIIYDANNLDGDSVDLLFDNDTLKGISVDGHAKGKYRDIAQGDTALTDIQSDSMYMRLTASGHVDTIWAHRNVVSTYYPTTKSDTSNMVQGKAMILAFAKTQGDLQHALVWGNARSTYYIRDADSRGKNVSSGDSILVLFANGKASELMLAGSVRGTYYPQD